MPANPSVPDIPNDWEARAQEGTPYLLGIASGDTAWRPTVVLPVVTDDTNSTVTAENGRPVFVA